MASAPFRYITKLIDLTQFLRVVRSIEDFWLTIVKLPNGACLPPAGLPELRK